VRPNSGIGHPGMQAPFGIYPTQDGWVTIAMSPYRTLVGVPRAKVDPGLRPISWMLQNHRRSASDRSRDLRIEFSGT
jgi:hypothetical protein